MPGDAKRWVFTLNNPTDDEEQAIGDFYEHCVYLVFGRETGEQNTPHLQGYFILQTKHNLTWIKRRISDRIHLEISRGTPLQASNYCKKDGDFEEFGELQSQGKRTDWERYRDWLKELDARPTEEEIAEAHPSLWGRYRSNTIAMAQMYHPVTDMVPDTPLPWQTELARMLDLDADDRRVLFVVDPEGGEGKSWFCRWMLMKKRSEVQVLGMGKRDDMAHMVDTHKRIFLLNVARKQMDLLQYSILEQLKDRLVSSPKYDSQMKTLLHQPHVVVFCNEIPDMERMTSDRYTFFTFDNYAFLSRESVDDLWEEKKADEALKAGDRN